MVILLLCWSQSFTVDKPFNPRNARSDVVFKCSKDTLKCHDTLVLHMTVPHGQDLAVLKPNKEMFFINF